MASPKRARERERARVRERKGEGERESEIERAGERAREREEGQEREGEKQRERGRERGRERERERERDRERERGPHAAECGQSSSRAPAQYHQFIYISALEATQGQMAGFVSQLPCKFHLEEVASAEDWVKICPQFDSRVVYVPSTNFETRLRSFRS